MKTVHVFILAIIALLLGGCNKQPVKTQVEQAVKSPELQMREQELQALLIKQRETLAKYQRLIDEQSAQLATIDFDTTPNVEGGISSDVNAGLAKLDQLFKQRELERREQKEEIDSLRLKIEQMQGEQNQVSQEWQSKIDAALAESAESDRQFLAMQAQVVQYQQKVLALEQQIKQIEESQARKDAWSKSLKESKSEWQ